MKTVTTGWVIIHPNGRVEMDYFNYADKRTDMFANTPARQREIMVDFVEKFRPGCEIMRTRVIPFEECDTA